MTRLTNPQFAEHVGCDFTTASRIRNGYRLPSLSLFARMVAHYHLDANEAVLAYLAGRDVFREYLNDQVFDPTDEALKARERRARKARAMAA